MQLPSLDVAVQRAMQAIKDNADIVKVEFGFQANGVRFEATLDGTIKHVTRMDPTGKDQYSFRFYGENGNRVYLEKSQVNQIRLDTDEDRRLALESVKSMLPATESQIKKELLPHYTSGSLDAAIASLDVIDYKAGWPVYGIKSA